MKKQPPIQIEPLLDPNEPKTENRYHYYLLEQMHSPPVSTPNATRWRAYPGPRTLRQGGLPDTRLAYGFIEYEEKLTWADLKKYNMLPFDYAESLLFDLWQTSGEDKAQLVAYFEKFFKVIEDDPDLSRIESALGLVYWGRAPEQIRAAIEAIEE
jgi:hypothetical protein